MPFTSFSNSGKPLGSPNGRMYAPEEGTFDRRKRIVIQNICRLIKEEHVPGDVVCEYVSQKKGEKNTRKTRRRPGEDKRIKEKNTGKSI